MKERTYIVRLSQVYGLSIQGIHRSHRELPPPPRTLTGVFITNTRCTSVIDSHGQFFAYQKLAPESYFDVFLEGEWRDKYSAETQEIMERHWQEDNL